MTAAKTGLKRINSGKGHRYVLDGEKCIGVTTAISGGVPKPALVNWAARMPSEFVVDRLELGADGHVLADRVVADLRAFNETRKWKEKLSGALPRVALAKLLGQVHYASSTEAAVKGTDVHGLAARLSEGDKVEVPEHLVAHVDAYLKFLNDWDVEVELTEFIVGHRRWKYAGTGDLIGTLTFPEGSDLFPEGGRHRGLFDIKTSGSGVYGETGLQLAAYGNAEFFLAEDGSEQPLPPVEFYAVVWVRADGYDLVPFDVEPADFRQFLYCLATARWVAERDSKDAPRPIKGDALQAPAVVS